MTLVTFSFRDSMAQAMPWCGFLMRELLEPFTNKAMPYLQTGFDGAKLMLFLELAPQIRLTF